MLGRCGFALESAAARVCREAGARVSTNIFVQDLDIVAEDQRRIEVVAEGLPVFHGAQLAIDTTGVPSPDGEPHQQCQDMDGAVLDAARRRKARTYPELTGGRGRAKLVNWGTFFGGDADVHPSTRQDQDPRHPCASVLDAPMGFTLGLRSSPGLRFLVVGASWAARSRW